MTYELRSDATDSMTSIAGSPEIGATRVTGGSIVVTRLYDVAGSIDVDRIERESAGSATRLHLTRAKSKAVFFSTPPVDIQLGSTVLALPDRSLTVEVKARVYDFGAASIVYEHRVENVAWSDYVDLVNDMDRALDGVADWEKQLERVRALIGGALNKPTPPGLEEDYVLATVRGFDPPLSGEEVLEQLDLAGVLTGEVEALSQRARQDLLRHAYTYYLDDLVVISWFRALILEPGGEPDVADILAMANAQLLELRYYDDHLDAELRRMYERIERARGRFGGLARRRYANLARVLHRLVAEVTEVSERIDNALVVTEDVYLARVYAAALEQFRVRSWSAAVDRKLAIIRDTYTALYDEATAARAEYLEIAIVVLIVVEILLALFA